jgi:hypothetical protein
MRLIRYQISTVFRSLPHNLKPHHIIHSLMLSVLPDLYIKQSMTSVHATLTAIRTECQLDFIKWDVLL